MFKDHIFLTEKYRFKRSHQKDATEGNPLTRI
jgi:hypothetical protein